jgi:hypothetical protein
LGVWDFPEKVRLKCVLQRFIFPTFFFDTYSFSLHNGSSRQMWRLALVLYREPGYKSQSQYVVLARILAILSMHEFSVD